MVKYNHKKKEKKTYRKGDMNMKDKMKAEAIKRMEKMRIAPEAIELFKEKEEVMVSVKEFGMVHKLPLTDG